MTDEEAAIIIEQEDFIVANLGTLSKEMSQGNGTALVAFSESLGCDQAVFPRFAETLQGSYQDIFAAPGALAVLDTAKAHLKLDATLNAKCRHIHI
jgi:hypothetical protein